jgi:four helix bundle protein
MSNIEFDKNKTVKIGSFKDLNCWKESHVLILEIYKITANFPANEIFALTSQMRRASISVTSNIAEGFARQGYKEKLQFYYISRGSLVELENQILISKDIGYINLEKYNSIINQINLSHQLINGIIISTKKHINNG